MFGHSTEFEENGWIIGLLLKIFLECDSYTSNKSTISVISSSREVPLSALLECIEDNLSNSDIDFPTELRKSLEAVAIDGLVSWEEFREALGPWFSSIDPLSSLKWQNVNNLTHVKCQNDELRARIRRVEEDNTYLREEITRSEDSVTVLRHQQESLKQKLERCNDKCRKLQKENDEQRDELNDRLKTEKSCKPAFEKLTKEHADLQRKLEAAEIEIQVIPPLNGKVNELRKKLGQLTIELDRVRDNFDKKEEECETLRTTIEEEKKIHGTLQKYQDRLISELRETIRQLMDDNSQLQSLAMAHTCSFEDRSFDSPYPNIRHCSMQEASYGIGSVELENSLYFELKTSGFTAECSRDESSGIHEFEEELNSYDDKVESIVEQVESIVKSLAEIWRMKCRPVILLEEESSNARTRNFEILNQRMSFLSHMITEATTKLSKRTDSVTQVRAEVLLPEREFSIQTFQDSFKCRSVDQIELNDLGEKKDEGTIDSTAVRDETDRRESSNSEEATNEMKTSAEGRVEKWCAATKDIFQRMLFYVFAILFIGLCSTYVISSSILCKIPSSKWCSIEEIVESYFQIRTGPLPPPI